MDTKTYTVSQVSALAHVTVRTLHHYDEIGLLVPSQRTSSGYRQYDDADLRRLREILVFREMGFSLDAIRGLVDEPADQRRRALLTQRELLSGELRKTEAVIRAIENAIQSLDGGAEMDTGKMFDGFDEFDHAKYADEARQRWGNTDAYKESAKRAAKYSKEDWNTIKAEADSIPTRMAGVMQKGGAADSAEAVAIAEEHRQHISRWFYPCSHKMHVGLADMYTADPRFREHYENRATGLAGFMAAAIRANAERAA